MSDSRATRDCCRYMKRHQQKTRRVRPSATSNVYNRKSIEDIKFIDIRYATDSTSNTAPEEFYTLQPGMNANNVATTDQDLSVDYSLIDYDDDWDYASKIANTAPSS